MWNVICGLHKDRKYLGIVRKYLYSRKKLALYIQGEIIRLWIKNQYTQYRLLTTSRNNIYHEKLLHSNACNEIANIHALISEFVFALLTQLQPGEIAQSSLPCFLFNTIYLSKFQGYFDVIDINLNFLIVYYVKLDAFNQVLLRTSECTVTILCHGLSKLVSCVFS